MKTYRNILITLMALLATIHQAAAQGTAFTYQGRLNDGASPANGSYDIRFYLRDALIAGNPVGTTNTIAPVVASNGLFTVTLDFSNQFPGAARWLEIGVRTNGSVAAYTTLAPRQALLPTPYAITASNLTGTLPTTQLSGPLNAATLSGSVPPASLTSVPAASLTGSINDGLLSGNVALRGNANSFTANNSFAAAIVGGWPAPVVWVQNSSPSATASPALTLQGVGNSVDGVLAVRSTGVGYLARFFTGSGSAVDITTNGNTTLAGALVVDNANGNTGSYNPGLTFGSFSGEGIASKRNPGGNQYGLDFYTGNSSRLSISNNGTINASGLFRANGGVRLNDSNIWFRADNNHGLGWYGNGKPFAGSSNTIDGPVLFGYTGGALGTENSGTEKIALSWDVNGNVTVTNGPIKALGGLVIENRTSDPASPLTGQIWLRTDL